MFISNNDYQVIFILFLERLKDDVLDVSQRYGVYGVSGNNKIVIQFTDCKVVIRIKDVNRLVIEKDDKEIQEKLLELSDEVNFFMCNFMGWVYSGLEKIKGGNNGL